MSIREAKKASKRCKKIDRGQTIGYVFFFDMSSSRCGLVCGMAAWAAIKTI